MHKAIVPAAVAMLVLACSSKESGPATDVTTTLVAPGGSSVSFHPDGEMYVFTRGMSLAVARVGDERIFLLTAGKPASQASVPAEGGEEPAKTTECVPAAAEAPVPGPQGGWHGHPTWSPDGRFIAFIAPWRDANCRDDDDADWDVWLVGMEGFDPDTWVEEVVPDKDRPEAKEYHIVGPAGKGLQFFQVSNTPGPDTRPAWVTCKSIAFATEAGVHVQDLSHIAGVCTKTLAEVAAEREARIGKLESEISRLERKISELETKVSSLEPPPAETE